MKTLFWILLFVPTLLQAETPKDPAPPSKSVLQTALSWMQSSDPERRQAAYRSVHLIGEEALPGFRQALNAALRHHEKRLGDVLSSKSGGGNPYRKLGEVLEELETERPRVYALIKTDYQKDPDEIRTLREEMEGITRLYERAEKLSSADPSAFDKEVEATALALAEIHAELARFDAHREGEDERQDNRSMEERKLEALEETFDGERYLANKDRCAKIRNELDALAKATSDNEDCKWASAAQKDFAKLLNTQRAVLGLGALRLEEKLSQAATGHSTDMRNGGFFAHISPVEGKASPRDRVRKAGFAHSWTGENIFVGSASHTAAYSAWFGSDGHRFIMFAKGPNLIGLGPVGKHWTLMTGRR